MRKRFLAAVWLVATIVVPAAGACDFDSWSSVTASAGIGNSLKVGGPETAGGISRYAGRCAMVATAAGNFVTDESPSSEPAFRARFYVLAQTAGGTATLLRARSASGTTVLTVRFNGTAFEFATRGAFAASQPVQPGRWYAIQLSWNAGAAMTAKVQGAGELPLPLVSTSAAQAGDRIDTVALGWVEGAASGAITVDAYEAHRNTTVNRLCRGNADGNRLRNGLDQASARREFLEQAPARGQPDCNEDGRVDSGDVVCMRNIEQAGKGDCDAFPDL